MTDPLQSSLPKWDISQHHYLPSPTVLLHHLPRLQAIRWLIHPHIDGCTMLHILPAIVMFKVPIPSHGVCNSLEQAWGCDVHRYYAHRKLFVEWFLWELRGCEVRHCTLYFYIQRHGVDVGYQGSCWFLVICLLLSIHLFSRILLFIYLIWLGVVY